MDHEVGNIRNGTSETMTTNMGRRNMRGPCGILPDGGIHAPDVVMMSRHVDAWEKADTGQNMQEHAADCPAARFEQKDNSPAL